jgi:hypothetical protein
MLCRGEKYLLPRLLTIRRFIPHFFWEVMQQRRLAVGYRRSATICESNLQGSSRTVKTTPKLRVPIDPAKHSKRTKIPFTWQRDAENTIPRLFSPWSSHFAVPIGGQNKSFNLPFLILYHMSSNIQQISLNISRQQEPETKCQYYSSVPN